ncbi:MAG: TetR/AcrR family transcriptional regulator [Acidobacteria bacterium]|nr:TetR/AcrR family transcriptional regulator [Acidobacteriota bacterium]
MPRRAGARNQDFGEKRADLLDALTDYAIAASLTRPSLRQFAMAAGQSEPTLRHYFGDRQGLVIEIIENISVRTADTWQELRVPAESLQFAIRDFLDASESGLNDGLFIRAHAFGIIEGFADPVVGRVYLHKMLEPSLSNLQIKLRSSPGGQRDEIELRAASLLATAPLYVISAHQYLLGGKEDLPIEVSAVYRHFQKLLGAAFANENDQSTARSSATSLPLVDQDATNREDPPGQG